MSFLAQITWNVSPEIFSIGFIHVRWYGMLFALAFVACYYVLLWIFKSEKKSLKDLEALTIYMVLSAVLGARLGHCLFYEPSFYLSNPLEILLIWQGGLASHGAGFGILLGLWLYAKKRPHINLIWVMDRMSVVIPIAAICVRLGNLFNSEIVGVPTDLPWAFVFPLDTSHSVVPRHPTQLYEALAYAVILIIMLIVYKRKKENTNPGSLMGIMLTLLFTARFCIEFLKENQSAFESQMSFDMGQYLSLPFILIGIFFFIRSFKTKRIE